MKADGYRADIDGLRAVAVLLVFAYHLWPGTVASGYIGVDIFFVISGYVVAKSSFARLTGRPVIDVLRFWMRRIRRILPLLLLVVLVGALATAIFHPPFPLANLQRYFGTGLAALFGLSNLFLNFIATDYFLLDSSQQNAFLHTWSLGVEEQYYVLFALVILAAPALLRLKEWSRGYQLIVLGLIVAASALYAATADLTALQRFYLPQARIWEIGIGSLLAFTGAGNFQSGLQSAGKSQRRSVLRLLALGVIFIAALFPHDSEASRAGVMLAGIFASIVLIAIVPGASVRFEPLATGAAVYIGRISYGLYLWHWVVLFALDLTLGKDTLVGVVIAILLTFALSALSFRYFESPLRNPRIVSDRVVLALVAFGFVFVAFLLWSFNKHPGLIWSGAQHPWTSEWSPAFDKVYLPEGRVGGATCHWCGAAKCRPPPKDWLTGFPPDKFPAACRGEGKEGLPRILSLGDSHSQADWGMLAYTARKGFGWSAFSKDGCGPGPGPNVDDECRSYWRKVPGYIRSELKAGDIIYISTDWKAFPDPSVVGPILKPLIDLARSLKLRVVIKGPLPAFPRPAYFCTPEWFRFDYSRCTANRNDELKRISKINAYLDGLARQPGVSVFRIFDLLCPGPTCSPFQNGHPMFRDTAHVSYWASSSLGPAFSDYLQRLPPTP